VKIEDVRKIFRGRISVNEPLKKYTSFQIGGPADWYFEPLDRDDLRDLLMFLRSEKRPVLMMGRGSNMLVSDEGIRGAVINLESGFQALSVEEGYVRAEAGVGLARFVDFCIQHEFAGVEMLPGIPGTIGGAITMNAGAYGGEISDHIVDVDVIRENKFLTIARGDAGFSYRRSGFQNDVVLGARFLLEKGNKAAVMKRRRELLLKRNESQPLNMPNSGSMFKNPAGTHAAKLLENAGLKGTVRGRAQISEKHANFFVNLGGASATDIMQLIRLARERVARKFNIELELEIRLVGFPAEQTRSVGA